jgi:hypothetical protein
VRGTTKAGVGITGAPLPSAAYWLVRVAAVDSPELPTAALRATVIVSSLTKASV